MTGKINGKKKVHFISFSKEFLQSYIHETIYTIYIYMSKYSFWSCIFASSFKFFIAIILCIPLIYSNGAKLRLFGTFNKYLVNFLK